MVFCAFSGKEAEASLSGATEFTMGHMVKIILINLIKFVLTVVLRDLNGSGNNINMRSIFEEIVVLWLSPVTVFLIKIAVMCICSMGSRRCVCALFFPFFFHFFCLFGIITIPFKKLFNTFFSQKQSILIFLIFFTGGGYLVTVVVAHEDIDGHKGRSDIFFEKLNPRKIFEPRMLFYLYDAMFCAQSLSRFSLYHLNQ